jgi:hypothetical protein
MVFHIYVRLPLQLALFLRGLVVELSQLQTTELPLAMKMKMAPR